MSIKITMKKDCRKFKAGDVIEVPLKDRAVNFMVGSNGCGKSTFSHFIRATKHSLKDYNKKMYEGMTNKDDSWFAPDKGVFEIDGLEGFDEVFVLDAIDDDPFAFDRAISAMTFFNSGAMDMTNMSKGERASYLFVRFLKNIERVLGVNTKDAESLKNNKKHSLIILDEVDEGMSLDIQKTFYELMCIFAQKLNATVLCISHNPMISMCCGTTDVLVYDMEKRDNVTLKDYIHDKLGFWVDID